ncbi:MAG: hypothetical protein K6G74_02880 [Bacilli bacterium]|nr:hypothetical protein [Bacilli bacterium]
MKGFLFLFVPSLYFAIVAYVTTSNLLIGGSVFLIYFAISILFIKPLVKRYLDKRRKRHEVFNFINHFIISLSITSSIDQAFEDATIDAKGEEKEVLDSISALTSMEKIEYLLRYFEDDIYPVFLSIVKAYLEEGGDLLEMSSQLLNEVTSNEEKHNSLETIRKKSLVQYGSLWFLSTIVLVFLRFGLSNFYDSLTKNIPYLLTSIAYFLIAIVSFYVYARAYTGEKISLERK